MASSAYARPDVVVLKHHVGVEVVHEWRLSPSERLRDLVSLAHWQLLVDFDFLLRLLWRVLDEGLGDALVDHDLALGVSHDVGHFLVLVSLLVLHYLRLQHVSQLLHIHNVATCNLRLLLLLQHWLKLPGHFVLHLILMVSLAYNLLRQLLSAVSISASNSTCCCRLTLAFEVLPYDLHHFLLPPKTLLSRLMGEPLPAVGALSRLGAATAVRSGLGASEVDDALGENDLVLIGGGQSYLVVLDCVTYYARVERLLLLLLLLLLHLIGLQLLT